MKKTEAMVSIEGMWEKFSRICKFQPPPMSKSVSSLKILTPKLATANKRKNNVIKEEDFILPSKSFKNLNSLSNSAPKIVTDNKFETMSDTCLKKNV